VIVTRVRKSKISLTCLSGFEKSTESSVLKPYRAMLVWGPRVGLLPGTRESLGPPLAEYDVAEGKIVLWRGFTNARVCLFLLKIEPIAAC